MKNHFHWNFVSGAILFFVVMVTQGCSTSSPPSLVGTQAPYTRVLLLDGEYIPLPLYDGRRVAVMFWASWCPHSRSVIGDFESLAEENASRKDLWFLAVSVDKATDEKQYLTFLKEQNLKSLRHAYSGNAELDEAYLSYGLRNIPYFYLLSADGTILAEGDHPGDLF